MSDRNLRIFISDCEGPITKNDNAFELTEHFIPDGANFFILISKYDDVLADVVKKPGYKPGNTLKLILPFLKAYEATDEEIKEQSIKKLLMVPGANDTLRFVRETMPSYIISTSYEQYISSLCELTGFPHENVFCTKLSINRYKINAKEITQIKAFKEEITSMPLIEIPLGATSINDLSHKDRQTMKRLDEIFLERNPKYEIWQNAERS